MPTITKTRSANQRLLDAWISRLHDLVRIENGLAAEARRHINPAIRAIARDLRLADVHPTNWDRPAVARLIYQRVIPAARQAYESIALQLTTLAPRWFEVQARTVFAKMGAARIRRLAPRLLKNRRLHERDEPGFTLQARLDPFDILRDFFRMTGQADMPGFIDDVLRDFAFRYEGWGDRLANRVANLVNITVDERRELLDAINDLEVTLSAALGDFERMAGDAVQNLSFESEELLLDYVGEEVTTLLYVAILDMRTCLRCGALSGTVWQSDDPGRPSLPLHRSCRCSFVPQIRDGGDAAESSNYGDWLRRQHWTRQRRVLGPTRYRLYRDGLPVDRFVNRRNRILRVDELPQPGKLPDSWRRSRLRKRR